MNYTEVQTIFIKKSMLTTFKKSFHVGLSSWPVSTFGEFPDFLLSIFFKQPSLLLALINMFLQFGGTIQASDLIYKGQVSKRHKFYFPRFKIATRTR